MANDGKRLAVTGGCGFLGRNLLTDREDIGRAVIIDTEECQELAGDDRITFLHKDIRELKELPDVDYLIHLAAYKAPSGVKEDSEVYYSINVEGTLNLLDVALKSGMKRFIFMSSSGIYAINQSVPSNEDSLKQISSLYAKTKIEGEALCMQYMREKGLPITIFRLFNPYGPGQNPISPMAPLVAIFKKRIREGKPITIYGDGNQTRDFIYVGEVVRILKMCLSEDPKYNGIFNLGTGVETSINELARKIMVVEGKEVEIEYKEARPSDAKRSCADVTKLERVFGPVDKGLRLDFEM